MSLTSGRLLQEHEFDVSGPQVVLVTFFHLSESLSLFNQNRKNSNCFNFILINMELSYSKDLCGMRESTACAEMNPFNESPSFSSNLSP